MYQRVTFTEQNDARPTYFVSALATVLILAFGAAHHLLHLRASGLLFVAGFVTLIALSIGVNCLAGCIWHPIPKDYRADNGLTTLKLRPASGEAPTRVAPMFGSLEDQTNETYDSAVSESQSELRDHIQWGKLFLVFACLTGNTALIVAFVR